MNILTDSYDAVFELHMDKYREWEHSLMKQYHLIESFFPTERIGNDNSIRKELADYFALCIDYNDEFSNGNRDFEDKLSYLLIAKYWHEIQIQEEKIRQMIHRQLFEND